MGGHDAIEVKVDCYYLEHDTEHAARRHIRTPEAHLPKHKSVVLGLITSKFPMLEDKALLKECVFEAARFVASGTGETVDEALQRISVFSQCGFASHEEGNLLGVRHEAKLQLIKEPATSIWADACW